MLVAVLVAVLATAAPLADGLMQVRKCCHLDKFLNDRNGECVTHDLKSSETANTTWPWWFPAERNILSRETNETLDSFPVGYQVLQGYGQPCDSLNAGLLPSYVYKYQFYDDGSMQVFNHSYQNNHVIYPPLSYCVDRLSSEMVNESSAAPLPDWTVLLCPCTTATCVLKCCPEEMVLKIPAGREQITHENCVLDESIKGMWTPSPSVNYHLLMRFPICAMDEDIYIPRRVHDTPHQVLEDGTVNVSGVSASALQFCGETVVYEGVAPQSTQILRCQKKPMSENTLRRVLYGSMAAVGAVFLALTLVIYLVISPEKSVHDKNVIAQTSSLLVGYVGLAVSQLALNQLPHSVCVFLGFVILYSFLASFFWLNVLCIDLAWAFSELRMIRDMMAWQNRRRFLQYSLYGWLSPAIIVLAVIMVEYIPKLPSYIIKPEFSTWCWFPNTKDSLAKLAYFYGPISVLLIANILLFFYTSYKILAVNRSLSLLTRNRNNEIRRLVLYLKLFALMGLSWVLEVVSWAVGGPDYYWYLTDLVNLFRAVFIFVTLCCKKQVLQELREKLCLPKPRGRQASSPSVTTVVNMNTLHGDSDRRGSHNTISSL